jgi:hypothetical protein
MDEEENVISPSVQNAVSLHRLVREFFPATRNRRHQIALSIIMLNHRASFRLTRPRGKGGAEKGGAEKGIARKRG